MTPQDTMRLALEQAYERGWIEAACWAQRDDLCADVGSPAYINDRAPHLDAVEAALAQPQKFTNDLVEFVADALTVDKDHARVLMSQALAQQALPTALEKALSKCQDEAIKSGAHESYKAVRDAFAELRSALAQQGEPPVAWMHEFDDGERVPKLHPRDERLNDQPKSVRPLIYGDSASSAPAPQAQPDTALITAEASLRFRLESEKQKSADLLDEVRELKGRIEKLKESTPAPHPDARTVVQQMVDALWLAKNILEHEYSSADSLVKDCYSSIAAGQKWLDENK